jgi:hypothetical protein
MQRLMRRIRGALGMAIAWGITWAVGAAGFLAVLALVLRPIAFWPGLRGITLLGGISGMISGFVFALALGVFHRNRTLADLRVSRMALWGAAAGIVVPLVLLTMTLLGGPNMTATSLFTSLGVLGLTGAVTGAGMVRLAQAGDPELSAGRSQRRLPRDD